MISIAVKLQSFAGKKEQMKVDSLVNEAKDLLQQLRTSTGGYQCEADGKTLVQFDDNVARIQSASEDVIEAFADYLAKNVGHKVFVEYDGRAMESTKSQQMLIQDRIGRLKRLFKSYGVSESGVVVSSALSSTHRTGLDGTVFTVDHQVTGLINQIIK